MTRSVPKRLAEIVIDADLASRDEVVRLARSAETGDMPLVAALVRTGGLDELALVRAIKRQTRVPLTDPAAVTPDPDALRELPHDVSRRLRAIPIALSVFESGSRDLHVAMADPTDELALAELEHITGCRVRATLIPLSAVEEMIETSYRSFVTAVMRREPGAPGANARSETTNPHAIAAEATAEAIDIEEITDPAAAPPTPAAPVAGSSTVPYHRVADEASLEVRHRALLQLLAKKNIISETEYREQVRELMKGRDDEP